MKQENNSNNLSASVVPQGRQMLNKVPQITVFFWIIKVLCTTVGETASDFLNVNLGFGLIGTSIVTGIMLAAVLFFQLRANRYIPGIYWLTVVLISIFGTLVTDNLTDAMGVPLEVSTIIFTVALAVTFSVWYSREKTLSIHSIFTTKREVFYWLAILFTFALGTAAGDLMAESLGLGYLVTGAIVVAVVVCVSIAWKLGLDSVLAFWIVYIMTRPLGASLGDYLSQPSKYGGLGLGATVTSVIFLLAILLTVIYLAATKKDLVVKVRVEEVRDTKKHNVKRQVVAVACVLLVVSGSGYYWRHTAIVNHANNSVTQTLTSFDVSSFITIEENALSDVNNGDYTSAKTCADDLEVSWDSASSTLKPMDKARWTKIDETIDIVLRKLRAVKPDAGACKTALDASLAAMK